VVQALASLAAVSVARIRFEEEAKIAHLTAESERLRTALLDSISHELRTPLAAIIGAAGGMIESEHILTDQDRRELLLTVREGAMRMNRLVTNLLGMVRLESGMLRLNKQWSDVSDIIGVALSQVQDSLHNRSVEITMPNTLPDIAVDDILIEQVLVNLLSNAIKYSPDGSSIFIDVKETDGSFTIAIRDQGIGIHPTEAEKIFDKFYRSKATRNIPGTGLGLAICKGVIVAHGGEISARRAEGIGTVVSIRLPLGEPANHKETTQFGSQNIDH
jgi:two-component system sensor histidine kinase KdpD